MGKCAIGGSFQLCGCKTLHIFVPFVCILMLLNLVHKLKCDTNLNQYSRFLLLHSFKTKCVNMAVR